MHHTCKQKKIYSHQLDKTQNKEINRKEHVLKLHSVIWRRKKCLEMTSMKICYQDENTYCKVNLLI